MIQGWSNYVIFKTEQLYETNTKFRGEGGKQLVIDPRFDPQKNCRIYGEVVAIPKHLSRIPMLQDHQGSPNYHETSPFTYKFLSDIEQEGQIGDRVYFHFNAIPHNPIQFQRTNGSIVKVEGVHPNRMWFIKVRYDMILAFVRDGVIIPVGGYVFCDPDFESWEEITRQVPEMVGDKQLLDQNGQPMTKSMLTKVRPEHTYLTAHVKHVGVPLKGDKCEVKVGQKIWYKKNADWLVKIEGRDYFAIRQKHIIGREELTEC